MLGVWLRDGSQQPLALFVDLHGHSRKQNVFMYGCSERGSALLQRVFPLLIARESRRAGSAVRERRRGP